MIYKKHWFCHIKLTTFQNFKCKYCIKIRIFGWQSIRNKTVLSHLKLYSLKLHNACNGPQIS